jgi:hypothetical protein
MLKNFWMGKDKKLCVDVQMQDLHILDFLNNHASPQPSPKERRQEQHATQGKVLSFGEDYYMRASPFR